MKAVKLLIRGKVQAVGYRRWFEKEALQLNLKGYVKNLTTGEVEAVVVGDEQAILSLIRHCYVGLYVLMLLVLNNKTSIMI